MALRTVYRLLPAMLIFVLNACAGKSAGPVNVDVALTDFGFESSLTSFQVGTPYHFVVTNKGNVPHEIMIVKPVEAGMMDMEEMDAMALAHIEGEDLPVGATAPMDYTFTEPAQLGALEFACHIEGHYEQGMKLPIEVK
jgi:uncharacterized cupredoxin-like copper-binding protein